MTATKRPIEWVSVRRAAELIGCAPQTVHRMIADGELTASRMTTEAGHQRTLVGLASVEQRAAERKALAA
jgi:hypothetical protein